MKQLTAFLATVVVALAAPPQSVTDLRIQVVDSAHVRLSWSPKTHDTAGQPLLAPLYRVYASQLPWFEPSFATRQVTTTAPELQLASTDSLMYFRIQVDDETH
jgi:hypothetical protein